MALYLVERDLASLKLEHLVAAQRALAETARRLTAQGRPVRHLRTTYLPEQGRCLCLFEAEGADAVRAANETAQFPYTRIHEALELPAAQIAEQASPAV